MIRNIAFILLFCSFSVAFAQMRQGRTQNVRPNTNTTLPEFKPKKFVGLILYDVKKVLKKTGIKKSNKNYDKIVGVFNDFNKEMADFSRINSFTFTRVKNDVRFVQKKAEQSKDFSPLRQAFVDARKALGPITKQVIEKENTLNTNLKPLLSEKQFSKWNKYKLKLKNRGR